MDNFFEDTWKYYEYCREETEPDMFAYAMLTASVRGYGMRHRGK